MMGAYALICGAMALAMWKLPGSFLPVEDGEIMVQYTLPPGPPRCVPPRCVAG